MVKSFKGFKRRRFFNEPFVGMPRFKHLYVMARRQGRQLRDLLRVFRRPRRSMEQGYQPHADI